MSFQLQLYGNIHKESLPYSVKETHTIFNSVVKYSSFNKHCLIKWDFLILNLEYNHQQYHIRSQYPLYRTCCMSLLIENVSIFICRKHNQASIFNISFPHLKSVRSRLLIQLSKKASLGFGWSHLPIFPYYSTHSKSLIVTSDFS